MILPRRLWLPPAATTCSISAATVSTSSRRGRSNCWLSTTWSRRARSRAEGGIKKNHFPPLGTALKVLVPLILQQLLAREPPRAQAEAMVQDRRHRLVF